MLNELIKALKQTLSIDIVSPLTHLNVVFDVDFGDIVALGSPVSVVVVVVVGAAVSAVADVIVALGSPVSAVVSVVAAIVAAVVVVVAAVSAVADVVVTDVVVAAVVEPDVTPLLLSLIQCCDMLKKSFLRGGRPDASPCFRGNSGELVWCFP